MFSKADFKFFSWIYCNFATDIGPGIYESFYNNIGALTKCPNAPQEQDSGSLFGLRALLGEMSFGITIGTKQIFIDCTYSSKALR